MKHKTIEWTITGMRNGNIGVKETYHTKRGAVVAMMAQRQPSTAIQRIGHQFIFALPS